MFHKKGNSGVTGIDYRDFNFAERKREKNSGITGILRL
jgi:hypothetical protein